jgi:hypothetical protein
MPKAQEKIEELVCCFLKKKKFRNDRWRATGEWGVEMEQHESSIVKDFNKKNRHSTQVNFHENN